MGSKNDLNINITAKDKGATKTIKGVDEAIKDTGKDSKSTGSSFKKMVAGVATGQAVFAIAQSALRGTVQYLKEATAAATDADETFSKFNAVFDEIPGLAHSAADSLANDFGLADSTAQALLSSTGDLLSGFGFMDTEALNISESVTRLSADLASFQNIEGGTAAASQALTSALLGETEAAKKLGIIIRAEDVAQRLVLAGKDKLTGSAKLQAEAQARLAIATEQSKNAIGDYARTADSAANTNKRFEEQQKRLSEILGASLRDSINPLKRGLADYFDVLATGLEKQEGIKTGEELFKQYMKTGVVASENIGDQINYVNSQLDIQNGKITKVTGGYGKSLKLSTAEVTVLKETLGALKTIERSQAYAEYSSLRKLDSQKVYNDLLAKNNEIINKVAEKTASLQERNEAYTTSQMTALQLLDAEYSSVYDEYASKYQLIDQQIKSTQDSAEKARLTIVRNSLYQEKELYKANFEERKNAIVTAEAEAMAAAAEVKLTAETEAHNAAIAAEKTALDEIAAVRAEAAAANQEAAQAAADAEAIIAQELTDEKIAQKERETAALIQARDTALEAGLLLTGTMLTNAKAQAAAEEKKNGKISKSTEKEAKRLFAVNKALQLAQIAINTASGISKALADPGGYAGIALATAIAALGGVQAGMVAGQELSLKSGGEFDVPSGHPNDSYPLRVESGEHVKVTPAGKSGSDGMNITNVNVSGSVWTEGQLASRVNTVNSYMRAAV